MAHCDSVVDCDRIELCRIAAELLYLSLDDLAYLVEVGMAWNELRERVHDRDDGLAHLLFLHSGCDPQSPCSGHSPTLSSC